MMVMMMLRNLLRRHSEKGKKPLDQDRCRLQALCMTTQTLPRHRWQMQWCSDTVGRKSSRLLSH